MKNIHKLKFLIAVVVLVVLVCFSQEIMAQCSLCTKTASQLGPKAAKGLNAGILYLMATPFTVVGFITYRWWKSGNKKAA